ncbi:type II CRISPR RNA-guided endonuclease Cas9 [Chryseobacterium vrystaatense]|uniref:CRISPR-associated endonuclease Cas9 n=1 Tax=Chryseobacterium vrystaatense TaxID=307480 RepID=A0A1M5G4Q6_9FLAO|nr:type II CRISPR RNA-guided endonuclease Cas9 [Chryseobacterium vrystaatense]SHF98689.1 CRISPR-associated endonuclease Csn1 [Chryseobacterium vrystaatense]
MMIKNILGLDLGTNSIGWALVEIDDENKIVRILGLGSRVLTMDAAEIAKFESGAKTESGAAKRTKLRSPRKLNERYLLRRDRLHCVLNLLNSLPEHYKLSIEFENEKGRRSGKFKKGTEEKLAYYKDGNGKFQFLFKDVYHQMENDFRIKHPQMFHQRKNGNQTKIPYDWTLYYLRHKAVTDRNFELTKEQLAWITLSFNQKRGYEKVIGQDEKVQKEGELTDSFVGKVKEVNKLENEDAYQIILVDNSNEEIKLFKYREESKIAITKIGDLKEVEIVSKYDDDGTIESKKTEYIINEIREFLITDVRNTGRKIKENFIFEVELETGWIKEQQSKFTPKWKDTNRDFIIKTKYDENGIRIPKGADRGRNINIPKEEDWTLMKLKTETSLTSFNTKNNTKGIASFVYYNLLQNPKQKIKADLITVIERDYYRDELDVIYKNQEKFHPELRNRGLYEQAIQLLYPNNLNHQKTIKELDFNHLIKEDILLYQRDLKSKKSLIANCIYEKENFERTDEKTGKKYKNPLKAIHKANPFYQEFRLWQFIKRLKIIKKEEIINEEIKINVDVTAQLLTTEVKEELYAFLNDKENVTEKDILGFVNKNYKDLKISAENYKWNFTSEKEPCNPTRYNFILRTKRIKGFDYRTFLTPENEYNLWHFFYSVKKKDEFNKGLNNVISRLLDKVDLPREFKSELVKNFSSFGGYTNDYGTYSEKAIKKILPFLRLGKYWNSNDIENILSKTNHEIKQKVLDKEEINGELKDFHGLWVSSACYLVYGRYSEVGEVQFWQSPYDIENYLKNEFKQHSLNNPTVEKVLVETLHVVKDIWKYYGKEIGTDEEGKIIYDKLFDRIHIELGREMKKNNKQKERDNKQNKENRKANERIVEILRELKQNNSSLQEKSPFQQEKLRILEESLLSSIEFDKDNTEYRLSSGKITKKEIKDITSKEFSKITRSDFERYKLWLDQRYQSPYSGRFIKLSDLFDRKKYEIEHVFPQERITLNALYNKVICETEINKEKKASTGYGFISNAKSKKVFCTAHDSEIEIIAIKDYEDLVNNNFSGRKREILLSKEIPEEFTNSQLNSSQYISKMAMKLLSNIVREKDEDTFRSKNVLATNGTITTTLKRHWQLNDAWNEVISPRFKRLNELTNTNLFGHYREINGHKIFINTVPEEADKNFDSKRIDHRHHALDALIVALTTENHVNYLNNISSRESNEEKLKIRKGIKFQLTNSRRGFNDEKEWYFLPPAQIKTKEMIDEFEYQFKDFKSKVFKDIVQNVLENTIASFKQKNRVIRQRWNKHLKSENGKTSLVSQEGLNEIVNYNVRKRLHEDTFYGKVKLQNNKNTNKNVINIRLKKAIEEGYDFYDSILLSHISILRSENISTKEIISKLEDEYPMVNVYEKFVATRFGNNLESFSQIPSDKIIKAIQSITDTGIQMILENHLNNYKEVVDGKPKFDTENAFSSDGVKELNKNIVALNKGKHHHPIYKVRTSDAMGTKFSISEGGQKSTKFVVTAAGSNSFCGFYQKGIDRKFYIPTLRESVESLKQGFEPCPLINPEDSDFKLIFVLNPSDLVYVPTEEERDGSVLIDFNNLRKEQMHRIYKFTDGSGTTMNFVPANVASLLFNMSNKEQEKAEIKLSIQNELGLGSPQSKNQNTVDGIQVKSVCLKLKVDRLGNISKA